MTRITPSEPFRSGWKLIHDPENRGRDEKWYLGIPEQGAVNAEVPSFVHMYLPDCHGIAWYQYDFTTEIQPDEDHSAILHFEMADFLCEVWLNGVRLGVHRGTENPFSFDASQALTSGKNRLCVRVSKPYTEPVDGYTLREIPHRNQVPSGLKPGSCYDAYGLHGAVSLTRLPKLRIADLYIVGNPLTKKIDVECTLISEYPGPVTANLSLLASEKQTNIACAEDESVLTLQPGETVLRRSLPIENMHLWDTDDPWLYIVSAELRAARTGHAVSKRCGFRTFLVGEDGYFYLNGRRIFLRCSHTGNCMPETTWTLSRDHSLIRKDFAMAKSIGMNMVRFISGAALPEQLDLCDELGLMVYEEPVSSWLQGDGPHAKELYQYDLMTMIRRDRSHPCITIWGLLNETPTTAPYGDCCMIARESIPEIRALDETRLLIYNSGRFDHQPWVGSVCNPYSRRWECLWDGENETLTEAAPLIDGLPGPTRPRLGDKHFYPIQPHSHQDIAYFRSIGSDTKRPFFLSEYGVGSLFDVVWLSRKFEQMGSEPRWPDVAMVYQMKELFLNDLKRYGFEREYAFPIDIMKESHRLHNRHRALGFDIFRSNPCLNGVSLTGLLDHSICGEGLWTLMREWKSGIADTLQDGFAPLRWCLFLSDMHLYSSQPFTIEGVLANEDVLEAKDYPIGLKIVGKDGICWENEFTLSVKPEDLRGMAVPVFKKELSLTLPEGEYTLCAEVLSGAAAACGRLEFFVSEDASSRTEAAEVIGLHLGEEAEALFRRKGVRILSPGEVSSPALAVVGDIPEEEKESAWKTIGELLNRGCSVFLASRFAMAQGTDMTAWLPIEKKPQSLPAQRGATDWLYHLEYLAKRHHPYFQNLPTGMMNWEYYRHIVCSAYFVPEDGAPAQDVSSICFTTGEPCASGYKGGMTLCSYPAGCGKLILSAYRLLENLNINPAADRLFLNILSAEYAAL